jgi:predicted site-specific integrase-resolvase
MTQYLRVKDIAESLGVHQDKVLGWIKSGDLVAVNVVQDLKAKNARWRIRKEDYEAFLESRECPKPTPRPKPRWKKPVGVEDVYK